MAYAHAASRRHSMLASSSISTDSLRFVGKTEFSESGIRSTFPELQPVDAFAMAPVDY